MLTGLKAGQILQESYWNRWIEFYNHYNNYQVVFNSKYWAIDFNGGDIEAETSFYVNDWQDVTVVGFHIYPDGGSSSGGYSVIDQFKDSGDTTRSTGSLTKTTDTAIPNFDGSGNTLEIKKAEYTYSVDGYATSKSLWATLDVAEDASKWNGTQTLAQIAIIVHRPTESKMDYVQDGVTADPATDWNPFISFFNSTTNRISYATQVFNVDSGNSGKLISKFSDMPGFTEQDILDMELWTRVDAFIYTMFIDSINEDYSFGRYYGGAFTVTALTKGYQHIPKSTAAYDEMRTGLKNDLNSGATIFAYDGQAFLSEVQHVTLRPRQAVQMFTKAASDSINSADLWMAEKNTSGYARNYFDGSFRIAAGWDNYQLNRFPAILFGFSAGSLPGRNTLRKTLIVGNDIEVAYDWVRV